MIVIELLQFLIEIGGNAFNVMRRQGEMQSAASIVLLGIAHSFMQMFIKSSAYFFLVSMKNNQPFQLIIIMQTMRHQYEIKNFIPLIIHFHLIQIEALFSHCLLDGISEGKSFEIDDEFLGQFRYIIRGIVVEMLEHATCGTGAGTNFNSDFRTRSVS